MGVLIKDYGTVSEIAVTGSLDESSVSRYKIAYLELINQGIRKIILNLSDSVSLDEAGLGATANLNTFIREKEGELVIVTSKKNLIKQLSVALQGASVRVLNSDLDALNYFQVDISSIPEESRINMTEKTVGDIYVITLRERLDVTNVVIFKTAWQKAVDSGHKMFVLDLHQVSFIDSSGLGSVIVLYKHLKKTGGRMAVVNSRDNICRVFQMTGLTDIFPIVNSADDAFKKMASPLP